MSNNIKKELEKTIDGYKIISKQIIFTGFISDKELVDITSNPRASIMFSFYEGLDLPILESYACGTPSFASNRSSTKEFVIPECSFNPYNNQDIAKTIIKIYNDEELCKKSLDFGRLLLKNTANWNIASDKIIKKITLKKV